MGNLSKKEALLIVEALTFTSCIDVCYDHTEKNNLGMADLCEKIAKEYDIDMLYNMSIYGNTHYEDTEIVERYKKIFKDIVVPAEYEKELKNKTKEK